MRWLRLPVGGHEPGSKGRGGKNKADVGKVVLRRLHEPAFRAAAEDHR